MSSAGLFRAAARSSSAVLRCSSRPWPARLLVARARLAPTASFSSSSRKLADDHHEETFEEFTARYENEFNSVQDVFELQRNLNNAFAYDLVPSPSVITAALKAARRVNDFPTAVRIFEGIKFKVENKTQYEEYLRELEPLREELGVSLKEAMYPDKP